MSEFSGLGEFLEFPIRTYSAGMRTRLGLSILTRFSPISSSSMKCCRPATAPSARHARERIIKLATQRQDPGLGVALVSPTFRSSAIGRSIIEQGRVEFSGSCEEAWERYERSSSGPDGAQVKSSLKDRRSARCRPAIASGETAAESNSLLAPAKLSAQVPANEHDGAVPRHPRAAKRSSSRAEQLVAIARKVGVPEEVADSLGTLTGLPELEALSMLLTHAPSVAMEQVLRADLEKRYGRDGARVRYLALALFQVPAAEARRVAQGIDSKHIEATLADLGADARSSLERKRALWHHFGHSQMVAAVFGRRLGSHWPPAIRHCPFFRRGSRLSASLDTTIVGDFSRR